MELNAIEPLLGDLRDTDVVVELCGFGIVAAAARTAQLISLRQPEAVVLAGIAGAIGDRLKLGGAYVFDNVACYGVGVGTGVKHQSAGELGWPHWDDPHGDSSVGEVIELGPATDNHELLTVCSASLVEEDVRLRGEKHPNACAEDMEGFGVALACHLVGVRLTIVRGISNVAGDRDKKNWVMQRALDAAGQLTRDLLALNEHPLLHKP